MSEEGKAHKTEAEISNVELQFMGNPDGQRDLEATVKAESQAANIAEQPGQDGLDSQDVTVVQSMDASDPPSTNMGEEEQ